MFFCGAVGVGFDWWLSITHSPSKLEGVLRSSGGVCCYRPLRRFAPPPLRENAQTISTTPPTAYAVTSPFVGEIEVGIGKGVQFLLQTPPLLRSTSPNLGEELFVISPNSGEEWL